MNIHKIKLFDLDMKVLDKKIIEVPHDYKQISIAFQDSQFGSGLHLWYTTNSPKLSPIKFELTLFPTGDSKILTPEHVHMESLTEKRTGLVMHLFKKRLYY